MNTQKDPNAKEGMRIKLTSMVDDPNPIAAGTEGTIILVDDMGVIHVNWDNGRRLGVIPGVDEYVLEPDLENVFDKINEEDSGKTAIKTAIKKTPSVVNKSMPSATKMPSDIKSSVKKSGIKTGQVTKNFKSANIPDVKVESEEDITEITGAGGAGGPTSSGPYVGPMGATKPTFGVGPLTSTGVAKPGPLHPKKKKKKIKENVFTKAQLVKEITNMQDSGIDDTSKESWADKNNDGWRWNDTPLFEEGEIVDPLAKVKTTWDDESLDISKEWDKVQRLKKEDLLRIIDNRINESNEVLEEKWSEKYKKSIDCNNPKGFSQKAHCQGRKKNVKEEDKPIEETTTFGSVFPSGNFPVVPAFAAKKGQWRTAKKPIWKGGKIVQKVENSGVLNPVNEANEVKYNPQGKIVKIKKKCTKFPYCSQGAVDKPLQVSDKVTEPGTYVEEELMRNIHEVALMTGKSFHEVYNIVKNEIFINKN